MNRKVYKGNNIDWGLKPIIGGDMYGTKRTRMGR